MLNIFLVQYPSFIDIQKAHDSVSHDFLLKVLKRFNFGGKCIDSIRTIYSGRKSYVANLGYLTKAVNMDRGIFQGCPISPYLFLLVIETIAIAIRQIPNIKGIPVEGNWLNISLLADDSTVMVQHNHRFHEVARAACINARSAATSWKR